METGFIEAGMLAVSRAGHDRGAYYIVWSVDREYVWLTDGRLRPLEKLKKKRKKHIQIIHRIPELLQQKMAAGEAVRNEDIKRAIKLYRTENQ